MTIENISKYLVDGADLTDLSEGDIQALISQSPFSAALRHLLVKKQSINQNFVLDDMSQAAYHSPHVDQFHAQHFRCKAADTPVSSDEDQDQKVLPSTSTTVTAVGAVAIADIQSSADKDPELVEDSLAYSITTEVSPTQEIPIEEKQVEEKQVETNQVKEEQVETSLKESKSVEAIAQEIPESKMKFAHLSDYAKWLMSTTSIIDIDHAQKNVTIPNSSVDTLQSNIPAITNEKEEDEDEEVSLKVQDKSMEYNDQIVSESLAELLVEQGLNNKAIAMYEKLSLIIPEKRAYFAVQIKKIK